MALGIFLRGAAAGFVIGAPIGPVGVLCLKRALTRSPLSGFASSLGATTADTTYGAVASLGLTFITDWFARAQSWLHLAGGAFLCFLGLKAIFSGPPRKPAAPDGSDIAHDYASAMLLTFANPGIFIFLIALLASLGVKDPQLGRRSAGILTMGIFAGSALWGLVLGAMATFFHAKFSSRIVERINGVSGAVILLFGALTLLFSR